VIAGRLSAVSRCGFSIAALLLVSASLACHTRAKSMAAVCELPRACPECLVALEVGDPSRYQDYLRTHAPHQDVGRMFEEMTGAPLCRLARTSRRGPSSLIRFEQGQRRIYPCRSPSLLFATFAIPAGSRV
jgi:hypothetical protein